MSKNKKKIHAIIKDFCNGSIKTEKIEDNKQILLSLLDSSIPQFIYRYRKVNNDNIDSFRNDEIYLSLPESFNDPTDCKLFYSRNTLLQSQIARNLSMDNSYSNTDDRFLDELLLRSVDDANFGVDVADSIPNGIRVACFSENLLSPLMWSHYAEEHKGFVLRYNFQNTVIDECDHCPLGKMMDHPKIPLYPVAYKQKRTDMAGYLNNIIQARNAGVIEESIPYPYLPLIEKGKEWEYEQEWRLICEAIDLKKMKVKANALFLGCMMKDNIRNELVSIAKAKGIEIYETFFNYEDPYFRMGIREYNPDTNAE